MQNKVYQVITDRIIKELEAGTVPWQRPWIGGAAYNAKSKKHYRGVNVFMLACAGYSDPRWVTYKQAQGMGGKVKKGEKGTPVVFWQMREYEDTDADTGQKSKKRVPILRYYTVFNACQTEGIEWPKLAKKRVNKIKACEAIAAKYSDGPAVSFGGDRAYYSPATDSVQLPERDNFTGAPEYYSTLFHELTHSTGHSKRTNRFKITGEAHFFGDENYAREELVAEMGAAMLCGVAGIERGTLKNSAAYIKNWLGALKDDPKLVVLAAAQAQRAADWIQGQRYEKGAE